MEYALLIPNYIGVFVATVVHLLINIIFSLLSFVILNVGTKYVVLGHSAIPLTFLLFILVIVYLGTVVPEWQ